MRIPIFLVATVLTLAACSSDEPPPPRPQKPQPTVFDAQLKALDKAKDVQKTMDQRKVDLDKKLKDEGG
jgi:hypothetical protein